MKARKKIVILVLAFIVVAIAQLWIPARMIIKYSDILENGDVVKMKMSPRDPIHPFKGKYLQLNFEENRFVQKGDWERGEKVYLLFHLDDKGFVKIDKVSKDRVVGAQAMKAKVVYYSKFNEEITIKYPFDKYYLNESKAAHAEQLIDEYFRDFDKANVYAEISLLDDTPVLKEVYVDNKPILEFIKR